MSLKWYLRPRMIVLNPDASVLEAARAIESNNVGAVLVHDRGRLAGIVTDRDLTIRVVGRGLDANTTPVGEVMTTGVVTLSPAADQSEAIRLMQQRNVRRIPLVDDGRLVGLVTLDDLLLDEAAPIEQLASVVEAQLGQGGPAPSPRTRGAVRSAARAAATYRRLVGKIREDAGLESMEQAETALKIVLGALVRRLTPDEAEDLIAQLPSLLQPTLRVEPPGPHKTVTRATIERELANAFDLDSARAAQLLDRVGASIAQTVSAGQMEDVRGQLPDELRTVFMEHSPAASH
ncbi:MAG TPA: CBS domain-containing protein [Gemmatimonadales bacterium]|nr:CBS domain-containing protein [Gemmatimonadales bacterium]